MCGFHRDAFFPEHAKALQLEEKEMPLRIVSYSMRREAYLPGALARCINARTSDFCRPVWGNKREQSAILFDGDTEWTSQASAVKAELSEADVVFVHNGHVAPQHQQLLKRKPVVTLAEDWLNVDLCYVEQRLPGVVLGQHQATMPILRDWRIVPLPVPLWEEQYQPVEKPERLTICYAPTERRGSYPLNHRLHWHSKRYQATMRLLKKSVEKSAIPLKITQTAAAYGTPSVAAMGRSHVVLDECVTGSYHRESLEGLAAGTVVINGLGLRPDILSTFRLCAGWEGTIPFHYARWDSLSSLLEAILQKGADALAADGRACRRWMEEHWDFEKQWAAFWTPAISDAIAMRKSGRTGKLTTGTSSGGTTGKCNLSAIVVSHNEGIYLRRTIENLMKTLPRGAEIVLVDDCSSDGSADRLAETYDRLTVLRSPRQLGVSSARNLGAAHAKGEVIVFCDAHVETPYRWYVPLLEMLNRPEVGAVAPAVNNLKRRSGKGVCGGTWRWTSEEALTWKWLKRESAQPYPVPLLCGCFIAMRRDVFVASGQFDSGMILYGVEDAELSMRLWTQGYECWVVPPVVISHRFGPPNPNSPSTYKFQPINFMHNELRLAVVHFGLERLKSFLEGMTRKVQFPEAFSRVVESDAWERRREIQATRRYDDDWFFARFGLT
jgi:GT2 family glycosyltransferase